MRLALAAAALLALLLASATVSSDAPDARRVSPSTGYISIIIDDVGHSMARGKRAIALPAELTFSVLPYADYAAPLAQRAADAGREVMIHMPMANISGKKIGPGGLTSELTYDEFVRLVDEALAKVPFARGMNNHMGSLLTTRPEEMGWLMQEVKRRNLYFIDSRTTHETVASAVARDHAVAEASRDVFLDNDRNVEAMEAEFERLIEKALEQGAAIAIAHPHESTLDFLETRLPMLADRGIRVVPVSRTIALRLNRARPATRQTAAD